MSAFNVVRMRVRPGRDDALLSFWREQPFADMPGLDRFSVVKTGDRDYCMIGEWTGMDAIVAARRRMIASLDRFRDTLEDLGGGLGLTDPVSGEAVVNRQRQ